jgi:hypothetical protein
MLKNHPIVRLIVAIVAVVAIAAFAFAATSSSVFGLFAPNEAAASAPASASAPDGKELLVIGTCDTAGPIEVEATAGTPGPTAYGTLKLAFDAINLGTHQGVINIEVCANTVEGTTPATLNSSGAGAAVYTSISVRPLADGLSISGNPITGFGVIQLKGADNVTIDGDNPNSAGTNRNLTINNTTTTTVIANSVIRIATAATVVTSADNITLRNMNLNGNVTAGNAAAITSTAGSSNSSFGIYVGGNGGATAIDAPTAITSVTTNTAVSGTTVNTLLIDNNAINQTARAIVFNGAATSVSTGVTISNNAIGDQGTPTPVTPPYTTPATTVYTKGIWVAGTNSITVSGNTLKNIMSYVGTTITSIELLSPIGTTSTISNNTVTNISNNGTVSIVKAILVSAATTSYTISGNTVTNVSSLAGSSGTDAIEATATTGVTSGTIESNKVTMVYGRSASTFGAYGINLTAGTNITLRNNFVSDINMNMTGGGAFSSQFSVHGIRIAGGTNHKIYNNSVNMNAALLGTATTSIMTSALCITATTITGLDVRNNILSNTMTGGTTSIAHVSLFLPTNIATAMTLTNNNNDYFSGTDAARQGIAQAGTTAGTGFYLASNFNAGATTPATNLRALTTILGTATNDDATIVTDPTYTSATDLHIPGTSPAINTGATIAAVTNDIDGDARPIGGLYEIGADERAGVALPGTLQLSSATYGGNEGTTLVATVNRVLGSSGTVGATYTLTDGTGAGGAACGVGVDYVNPGPTLLSFGDTVTSQPINVMLCTDAVTDPGETFTITISLPTGGAMLGSPTAATATIGDVPPPFNGTYTVGTGGTYPSLTNTGGIFEAINLSGATGNINIEILSNLSGELGTHPLNQIAGGYSTTMYPCSNPITITGTNAGALIRLNGADFVTINGDSNACTPPAAVGGTPALRHLTITNTNTGTSSAVIGLISLGAGAGATNNTIQNTNLIGTTLTATNGTLVGIYSGGSTISISSNGADNDTNTFTNNNITKSQYGIYSAGESAANKNSGTVISENQMNAGSPNNLNTGGIFIRFDNGAMIDQNDISVLRHDGTTGQSGTAFGIALGVVPSNIVTGFTGSDVIGATVSRNKINGVTQLSSTGFSAFGIVVNSVTSGTTLVVNNMVSGVRAASTATDFSAGIVAGGGTGSTTQVYHNSVSMTGSRNAATYPSYGLAIDSGDPIVDVRNNIFYNTQTSTSTGKMYAIGTGGATFANLTSDYNDFFVSGASAFVGQTGGLFGGTDRTALSDWQTATGKDPASESVDPVFINPANDLHLNGLTPTPLLGDGLTGFASVDFDSDPRPATAPEIGADELVQSAAGSFPAGIFYNAISAPGDQMAGSATITNSMTLNGILNTGNFNTLTMGCTATFANAGGGNYVVGTVNKQYCGTGSFTYPVGTTPDNVSPNGIAPPEYTPVTVNVTAGTFPSFLSVKSLDAFLTGFDTSNSLSRNWELTELGDITADLSFTYLDGAITDINGTEANYIVYRRNSNGTTDPMCLVACVDTGLNTLGPVTGVTQFSRWTGAALVPTAAGVQVSGRVLTPNGAGLRNARVMMTDTHGVTRTVLSSSFGYYVFDDVRAGETYVITVGSKRFTFTPRTVQVLDELTDVDFVAEGER